MKAIIVVTESLNNESRECHLRDLARFSARSSRRESSWEMPAGQP